MSEDFWKLGPNLTVIQIEPIVEACISFSLLKKKKKADV